MQEMVFIYHLFLSAGAILLGVTIATVIIGIPLFWRFDRMFKGRPNVADLGVPGISIQCRILSYMFAIVFKNRSTQHRYFKYTFQGYDFQTNTNLFGKIYSYICVCSSAIMLFFSLLWAIVGAIIFLQTGAWPQ